MCGMSLGCTADGINLTGVLLGDGVDLVAEAVGSILCTTLAKPSDLLADLVCSV